MTCKVFNEYIYECILLYKFHNNCDIHLNLNTQTVKLLSNISATPQPFVSIVARQPTDNP